MIFFSFKGYGPLTPHSQINPIYEKFLKSVEMWNDMPASLAGKKTTH